MTDYKMRKKILNVASLVLVFLMMAGVSVVRDGRLFGHDFQETEAENATVSPVTEGEDGTVTVNTTSLCESISGYAGQVPVEVTLRGGKIERVDVLPNSETPGFMKRVIKSGLTEHWTGMTAEEAITAPADAVTGATFTSTALISNVREASAYYTHHDQMAKPAGNEADGGKGVVALWISLAVILAGALLPLRVHGKVYRTVQQLLNVGVLGFWTGTFVNYTMLLRCVSEGITMGVSAMVPVALLTVAFIFPLFGRQGHYCAWVCPLGSLQELALKCNPRHRWRAGRKTIKVLTRFRTILWCVLMVYLWTGMWTSWIDYELFSAFIVESASAGILIAGVCVIVLSIMIPRPYCRFVCPTGVLMRMSQNVKTELIDTLK